MPNASTQSKPRRLTALQREELSRRCDIREESYADDAESEFIASDGTREPAHVAEVRAWLESGETLALSIGAREWLADETADIATVALALAEGAGNGEIGTRGYVRSMDAMAARFALDSEE